MTTEKKTYRLYQEEAMNDDAQDHQDHQDDTIDEGGPGTAALYTAKDHIKKTTTLNNWRSTTMPLNTK